MKNSLQQKKPFTDHVLYPTSSGGSGAATAAVAAGCGERAGRTGHVGHVDHVDHAILRRTDRSLASRTIVRPESAIVLTT